MRKNPDIGECKSRWIKWPAAETLGYSEIFVDKLGVLVTVNEDVKLHF